mmetsp:Transcript_157284/g.279025  ORF Transcript_157284/g.279025 Transcript_157284/m.279025 type:complete len:201 (+) Transcript_157284:2340-2942(+)
MDTAWPSCRCLCAPSSSSTFILRVASSPCSTACASCIALIVSMLLVLSSATSTRKAESASFIVLSTSLRKSSETLPSRSSACTRKIELRLLSSCCLDNCALCSSETCCNSARSRSSKSWNVLLRSIVEPSCSFFCPPNASSICDLWVANSSCSALWASCSSDMVPSLLLPISATSERIAARVSFIVVSRLMRKSPDTLPS